MNFWNWFKNRYVDNDCSIEEAQKILDEMYTSLDEAKQEIWNRWNDKNLRAKIKKFLKADMPEPFGNEPKAVLFRYIASPNFEYFRVKEIADKIGLKFLYLEFFSDKFCTVNPEKKSLGRIHLFYGKNKNEQNIIKKMNIFDLSKNDGKKFNQIVSFSGDNLVNTHHKALLNFSENVDLYDISDFAQSHGCSSMDTYPYLLAIFCSFGILFEDYDLGLKEERKFVKYTVYPAFKKITKLFGVKPLIVKLFDKSEVYEFWNCYPKEVEKIYGL